MASSFVKHLFEPKKSIISLIIILMVAVFGVLTPFVPAQAVPSCPLSSQSGRTIITFGGATLNPNAKLSPVSVTIPVGTYNITLVSYDDHASETGIQPNEQWYIIAKNSQGAVVSVSDSIADLANGQDTLTHVVNTDFRMISQITSISAYHTVQNGSTDPNSVIPLCAAFDSKNKFPVVSTNEASFVVYDAATLYGQVDPIGMSDTVRWFEWGTSTSLGSKTQETAQGTAPSSFSFRLTSLLPDTIYYFRAMAKNAEGTAYGSTLNFRTKGAAEYTPFVSTDATSGISESQASLNGYVNPNGSSDTVRWFEWGLTPTLGSKSQEIAVGSAATTISQVISGLARSTTYYVKAFARNAKGTSEGGLITFQTLSTSGSPSTSSTSTTGPTPPGASITPTPITPTPTPTPITPTAITKIPTFIAQSTVVLNGLALADTGVATNAWFEWGLSQSLGLQTHHRGLGSIASADFADSLIGLAPNTIYYYRAVVENIRGKSFGITFLFRTLPKSVEGSPSGSPSPSPLSSSSSSSSVSSSSLKPALSHVSTYVPGLGNVALLITPSQDIIRVGEKVKFTITFENKVKDFLSDALLTVTLPPEFIYKSAGSLEGLDTLPTVEEQIITLPIGDMIAGHKGTLIVEATLKIDTPDKKMFTTAAEITYVHTVLNIGGKETAFAVNTADASWHWQVLFAGGFLAWFLWGFLGLLLLAILLLFFWKRRKEKEEEN